MDKLRKFLIALTSSIQAGKIYSTHHPRFKEFLESSFQSLQDIFRDQEELAVGVVEGEIASGKEVFFDLSEKLKPLLSYLEERGIERFSADRSVTEDEWQKFICFLALPRGKSTGDPNEYLMLDGVRNIRAGKIQVPSVLAARSQVTSERQYESALASLSTSIQKILNQDKLDAVESKYLVFTLMETFHGFHQELLGFPSIRMQDRLLLPHFLNTAILATFFATSLGFSRDDVLDIGVAALYHDVGRVGPRREGQFAGDGHSLRGARVLLAQREAIGPMPAIVAFEHHLRYDLKGSKRLSYPNPLHPVTRLISVCDIYDELYQKRFKRRQFTSQRIYEIMTKGRGSRFDPEYVDSFYRIMGVWPLGMHVVLSDGRVAVVRKINEADIFSPVVETLDVPEKRKLIDLASSKEKLIVCTDVPISFG